MGKLAEVMSEGGGFPTAMPDVPELTVPQQMACAARILASTGYALDVAGHITVVRDDSDGGDGTMWCTPYGLWWRELTASDIIVIDADGTVIDGRWDVTPAVFIHTEIHRARSDAQVLIHNHPYYGTLLSTMHMAPDIIDQQATMFDGDVMLFDEYTGGIDDVDGGKYLAAAIGGATAVILANHGVLLTGATVMQAVCRATNFERMCRLNYDVLAAGQKAVLVPPEQRALIKRTLNSLSVDVYWGGEVRHLLSTQPDILH